MQVKCGNRTARSLPYSAIDRNQNDRTIQVFDEPRCHDPDHAGMPAFGGQHQATDRIEVTSRGHFPRRVERLAIDILPRAIDVLEVAGERVRFAFVGGQQEVEATLGVADAPNGVEPRREYEPDAAGGE